MIAKFRSRMGLAIAAVAVLAVLIAWFVAYPSYWWTGPATSPLTLTVAGGCPATLRGHNGVDPWGLGARFEMVPRNPVSAVVCPYRDDGQPSKAIAWMGLDASQATSLAAAADAAATDRGEPDTMVCTAGNAAINVVAFHYQGRSDADVWEVCPGTLTNGVLRSTSFYAFDSKVDQPNAPAQQLLRPGT